MNKPPPTLGFICGVCLHGMRSVCDSCEEQEAENREMQRRLDACSERNARDLTRNIPGVADLEDLLGVRVTVESGLDEDGDLVWEASAILGREKYNAIRDDMDAAVAGLRVGLIRGLRGLADELEERES